MNPVLRGVAQAIAETFPLPEPIVEIGSFQVTGQEEEIDLRSMFPGRDYRGIDIRPGPGVDLVADVEDLPFDDSSIGTVISLNTFEHVRRFWRGFEEIQRVLRPDGALLVSCPFNVMIHNHPSDYWRFTPEAFAVLLEDYPQRIMGWHGPDERPENIWCLALREQHAPITPTQFARYRANLPRPGVWPLRRQRRWRYRLFDWIDGRRWCAPLTQRERIRTELVDETENRDPLPPALLGDPGKAGGRGSH